MCSGASVGCTQGTSQQVLWAQLPYCTVYAKIPTTNTRHHALLSLLTSLLALCRTKRVQNHGSQVRSTHLIAHATLPYPCTVLPVYLALHIHREAGYESPIHAAVITKEVISHKAWWSRDTYCLRQLLHVRQYCHASKVTPNLLPRNHQDNKEVSPQKTFYL